MDKGLFEKVGDFIRKIDAKSWPAFFMFVIVLVAAGALNYVSMQPIVGGFAAVTIAMFFGIGVLSWHIVESRTDDSKYQEDVAQFAKWTNAILDGILLVVNLFRAELRVSAIAGMTWADTLAFCVIGLSAVTHVTAYLLWTQNDPRRAIRKDGERSLSGIYLRTQRANNAIKTADTELSARKWAMEEEARLRAAYASLPRDQVDDIVRVMKESVDASLKNPKQEKPKQEQTFKQRPAFAADTAEIKPPAETVPNAIRDGK